MPVYNKIGFHGGSGPGMNGLMEKYVGPLNAAGVPAVVKSAYNAGVAAVVAQAGIDHGAENQVILRFVGHPIPDNPAYDVPPREAAEAHWVNHIKPKLDSSPELLPYKDHIWIEMINEADKERWGSHVCQWATRLAELANGEGWKAALLGANAGTPELQHWLEPGAVEFLRYASARPDKVAISIHEAKAPHDMDTPIVDQIPVMVGRINLIFAACDSLGIPHPTVFVSEWAWAYASMPDQIEDAMQDVRDLAAYYAQFPTVRGAFLWNLTAGPEWSGLPERLNRLLEPMAQISLTATFAAPQPPESGSGTGPPAGTPTGVAEPEKVLHTIHLLPQDTTLAELAQMTTLLHPTRSAFTYSAHVAWAVAYSGTEGSKVVVWAGDRWQDDIFAWLHEKGIQTEAREFGA